MAARFLFGFPILCHRAGAGGKPLGQSPVLTRFRARAGGDAAYAAHRSPDQHRRAPVAIIVRLSARPKSRAGPRNATKSERHSAKHRKTFAKWCRAWTKSSGRPTPKRLNVTSVSVGAAKLLGYPAGDDRKSSFWSRYVHPDDRERLMAEARDALKCNEVVRLEHRMVSADGRTVWVRDSLHPLAGLAMEFRRGFAAS